MECLFYTKILKIQEENENDKHSVKSREHEKFYEEYLKKCRYQDV